MGSSKQSETPSSSTTVVNQTQAAQPTAAESEMQQAQLAQFKQYEPGQTEMFKNAFALGNQLLTSFGDQQGDMWKSLIGGVTNEQQQSMISEQDRYLTPQLQAQGIYDSGLGATMRMRSATDLANQNAQFNVGALQNALNLALSGQAQVQAPAQGATNQLASQLAGLRSISNTGTTSNQSTTATYSNPFMSSFLSSAGKTLGSPSFSAGPFSFGG